MANKKIKDVVVKNGQATKRNYEKAVTDYQMGLNGGVTASMGGVTGGTNRGSADGQIRMDVAGMEFHIENIQKSIVNLKSAVKNIDKLKQKSSGADWKTLNKEAYEALLDGEKKYFQQTILLLEKFNAHINYSFREIVNADKKLSKYLS